MSGQQMHTLLDYGHFDEARLPYYITTMNETNINQILKLQDEAFETCTKTQSFVVKRDKGYLQKHFQNNGKAVGAYLNGELKAQALITEEEIIAKSVTGNFNKISHPLRMSTIGLLLTSPDLYEGSFGRKIITTWMEIAKSSSSNILHARVHESNIPALNLFTNLGLISQGAPQKSPDRNAKVFYMYKNM